MLRNIYLWEAILSMCIAALTAAITGMQEGQVSKIIALGAVLQAMISLRASLTKSPSDKPPGYEPTEKEIVLAMQKNAALYIKVANAINAVAQQPEDSRGAKPNADSGPVAER